MPANKNFNTQELFDPDFLLQLFTFKQHVLLQVYLKETVRNKPYHISYYIIVVVVKKNQSMHNI